MAIVDYTLPKSQPIPYHIYHHILPHEEARKARKLENIYHRGQDKIWDGREVFDELMRKHGGVRVKPEHREPLRYVLSVLMWGEYAAWRVSAELADRLEGIEPRLAATSQSHDEARHFYVMHDYIKALGFEPCEPDAWGKRVIELTLKTGNVAHKLMGMQLMIETIALTMFKNLRDANIDPVLSELMPYYERDEARHVGLGTQLLPNIMNNMSKADYARMGAFQIYLMITTLQELKELEPRLAILGVDPARLLRVANDRFFDNFRELKDAGKDVRSVDPVAAVVEGLMEVYVPHFAEGPGVRQRIKGFVRAVQNGARPMDRREDYLPNLTYADYEDFQRMKAEALGDSPRAAA